MLVVGSGATGVQVASIFNGFGSRVQLFEAGPRILSTEDEDVSAAVAAAFRESGIVVHENFGAIEAFEKTPSGVRMVFSKDGARDRAEAAVAVMAVGWVGDTAGLNLATAGVETDAGLRACRPLSSDLRTTRLRRRRHHRPLDVGPAGHTRRLRRGHQRRARPHHVASGPGQPDRQLHRP